MADENNQPTEEETYTLDNVNVYRHASPIKQFADNMSTGVSYFEQFVWDLEQRGVSNIDIPVLIFGVDIKKR